MACSDPTEAQPVECTAAPHARLSGRSDAGELRFLSEDLGRRRTARRIALDDMLTAIRLDFRVLWAGLTRSVDAADAPRLFSYAEEVLKTLEEYSSYAQRAYLKEAEALAADDAFQLQRLLTHFLSADDPRPLTHRVAEPGTWATEREVWVTFLNEHLAEMFPSGGQRSRLAWRPSPLMSVSASSIPCSSTSAAAVPRVHRS
ncbi:hypothetical protein DCC24_06555 [Auritidibacter sp. NML100628]|nr:hypothetical protein DCC24_06555 [Auritidibacter sp. NML100628]